MFKTILKISAALSGVAILCFVLGAADADTTEKRLELDIEASQELSKLGALVWKGTQVSQDVPIEKIYADDTRTSLAIVTPTGNEKNPVYALAMASAADGQLIYSNLLQSSINSDTLSLYSLPVCREEAVDIRMQSQLALITNLVQVRAKRRANYESKLDEKLTGELLEKLKRYETGFGIQRSSELSANLPPTDLVDRLDRILHTLRKISPK